MYKNKTKVIEGEIWLDCPEYEKVYQVSNLGRVRSKPIFIRHDGIFGDENGYIKHVKIKNQTVNRYGYLTTKLCYDGKCRRLTIHRLVAKAFLTNENNYNQVNHINGNKFDNRLDNLEWVSASQNIQHAYDTGLMTSEHMQGSKHFNAKVNEEDVIEMRRLYDNKEMKIKQISEKYNIGVSTTYDICKRKTWKNI